MKCVLDLSPERLGKISRNDPDLDLLKVGSFKDSLDYSDHLTEKVAPKIGLAIAEAIGNNEVVKDASYNYRMVDYYPRETNYIEGIVAPRCGEHRDFGSWTLVFPSKAGFQVLMNGTWMDLPHVEEGSAILYPL
jgi:isopenicillin N synthase-like dioxygenase